MRRSTFGSLLLVTVSLGALGAQAAGPVQGFLENRGQFDPTIRYFGIADGMTVRFERDRVVLGIPIPQDPTATLPEDRPTRQRERRDPVSVRPGWVVVTFSGRTVCDATTVDGEDQLPGRYTFLLGRDRSRWATEVPSWGRVVYRDVAPGVDVAFFADGDGLAYDIVGGASAESITLSIEGDARIVDDGGALRAGAAPGGGPVSTDAAGIEADPVFGTDLRFSTFLGGARDEAVYAVAVDSENRAVVAGATRSSDFPTSTGAFDEGYDASFDAFVTKFDADGATVLWSTFLGGVGDDRAWALRLDAADRPVLAGVTTSADFPTAGTPYADALSGGTSSDAFVARLAADGSALDWSTYYGGTGAEWDVSGLALDSAQRPVICGSTRSDDLPLSAATVDDTLGGARDGFVARLSAEGSALDFATYLGGSSDDVAEDVAVAGANAIVAVGRTGSDDFPTTAGAWAPTRPGPTSSEDAFVVRLDLTPASLAWGTYLGAENGDQAYAVAVDGDGRPVVAGATTSAFFPTTAGSLQPVIAGSFDAFVTSLAADGSTLAWSTYLGGSAGERALDLTVDRWSRPLLTGWTCSEDFPLVWNPYETVFQGPCESFATRLHEDGTYVEYSSFVGGWRDETGYAVALDARERPVVGGETISTNFPVTSSAYDPTHNSPDTDYDGFVFALLPPTFCVETFGAGPTLSVGKASRGTCPAGGPIGGTVQIVEGALRNLSAVDIGPVRPLACDATTTILDTDTVPPPGSGLFVLARYSPGGAYTDGAGAGLVGTRTPTAGDCP